MNANAHQPGRRLLRAAIPVAGLALGLVALALGPGWSDPVRSGFDLGTGVGLLVITAVTQSRAPAFALLTAATAITWFAGTAFPLALFWHRGPLVQLLLTYPVAGPRARWLWVACGLGYLIAAFPAIWSDDIIAIAAAAALVVGLILAVRPTHGRLRRQRMVALLSGSLFAAAIAADVVVRVTIPDSVGVIPALLGYDIVILTIVIALAVALRPPDPSIVTDLVVDLGDRRSSSLRATLARALGDRSLEVGYWDSVGGIYRDANGDALRASDDPAQRTTVLSRDGERFMVLVHDQQINEDPALTEAVAAAAQLTAVNLDLQNEIRRRLAEVVSSRRRLLAAEAEERRRLSRHADEMVMRPLVELAARLGAELAVADPDDRSRVEAAALRIDEVRIAVENAVAGLAPRELSDGLLPAIRALAARGPVPVTVSGVEAILPREVETALYYGAAEAVTNAIKHAHCSRIVVELTMDSGRAQVQIVDDGGGGASLTVGGGLTGIADRIGAIGGTIDVDSTPGSGTRIRLDVPTDLTVVATEPNPPRETGMPPGAASDS